MEGKPGQGGSVSVCTVIKQTPDRSSADNVIKWHVQNTSLGINQHDSWMLDF